MSYGFNCFLEGGRFVKLPYEWKLRDAKRGSVLQNAVNTEEALKMFKPNRKDGRVVRKEVQSIETAQEIENPMSGSIRCS